MKSKKQSKVVEESIDEPMDETMEEQEEIMEEQDDIIEEMDDATLQTEDIDVETGEPNDICIEIDEPQFLKDDSEIPIVDATHRTSKNKMTRYEFVRIKGERIMQLSKGAKPLIRKNKQSEELTYKEIAVEEIRTNMVPFKIKRFVKDHYEIWRIDELDKKHLEPLFN